MTTRNLIIHLIREELRNKRLMYSFEELGFDCTAYTMKISHVILELAGYKQITDELTDSYIKLIEKALEEITFWNMEEMIEKWSVFIYNKLEKGLTMSKKI